MPTYDYVCTSCGYQFEKFQKMTEEHLKNCPKCRKDALKRKIGRGAAVIFKEFRSAFRIVHFPLLVKFCLLEMDCFCREI